MRNVLPIVASVLALVLSATTLPSLAADGLQSAVMTTEVSNGGKFMPVIFKSGLRDMKVEEIAAIAAGAAIIGTTVDMFFDSGLVTILAITAGAAVGSYWYEEELWPFSDKLPSVNLGSSH